MSRPLRVQLAGALYHVIARGNNRERIVHDEVDVAAFLSSLAITCQRYAWRVFGWCLMPNHYHLVVETMRPTLSRGMLRHNALYAQRFNRRHKRVGHVFQARFKAMLIEKELYLLTLLRYVELNPWRAAIVNSPTDWPWSSIHVSLGLAPVPAWSAVRDVWSRFGPSDREATSNYCDFLREGMHAAFEPPERRAVVIGSEDFATQICARSSADARSGGEIPRNQRAPAASLADIFARHSDPDAAIKDAYLAGYRLREMSDYLGVHYSTVSLIARRTTPRRRGALTARRHIVRQPSGDLA